MTVLYAIAMAAVVFGWWRLSLRLWPYARCGRCKGGGRNWGSNSKRSGRCGRCGGSGRRLRWGAKG